MKKLILILAVALSGCAVIFPIPHDGAVGVVNWQEHN
jgi:uncharacterized protein YceK